MLSLYLLINEMLTPLTEKSHMMLLGKAGWMDWHGQNHPHCMPRWHPCSVTLIAPTGGNARFRSQEEPGPISPVIFCFPVLVGSFVYSNVSFSLCIRELKLLVLISVGRNVKPHIYISVLAAKNKWTHIPRSWERPDALLSLFESILMPVQVGSGVYTHITLASKDTSRGHSHSAFFQRSDVW